jgi:hypothetical protein
LYPDQINSFSKLIYKSLCATSVGFVSCTGWSEDASYAVGAMVLELLCHREHVARMLAVHEGGDVLDQATGRHLRRLRQLKARQRVPLRRLRLGLHRRASRTARRVISSSLGKRINIERQYIRLYYIAC